MQIIWAKQLENGCNTCNFKAFNLGTYFNGFFIIFQGANAHYQKHHLANFASRQLLPRAQLHS